MNKKYVIFGVIALVVLLSFVIQRYIGDIRPLFSPSSDITLERTKSTPKPGSKAAFDEVDLTVPDGYRIGLFAEDLGNARDLQFTPAGTLLISDTSGGNVRALPDANQDLVADENKIILENLNKPHGLAFYENKLYVVEETQVVRYSWNEETRTAAQEQKILDLPAGGRHFSRSMIFDDQGNLYISLGSTCDVCVEKEAWIGTTIITNAQGQNPRVFAKGLRNAVFLTQDAEGNIFGTEMGRDFLGDTTPPDEINLLTDGGDYGWPLCYGNKVHDTEFDTNTYIRDPCEDTIAPAYEIPAHSAPLGLTFVESTQMPDDWQNDLLVVYHGSWNRTTPTGYKVVRLNRDGNKFTSEEDLVTGFLKGSTAAARPADVTFDEAGSLFISDDKSGAVYVMINN
ncbi:MAG: sorbosone dehydrogenase family protein [Weeksellaceae bacterium]